MIIIANTLTFLNLACGFLAMLFAIEGHFTFSCWAILLSVAFDGLDGYLARVLVKSGGELGRQLDSLVDAVSFGVVPVIVVYFFVWQKFHWAVSLPLLVYSICSIIRLARFNLTSKERLENYFYGLPTTISGGLVASFILVYLKYALLPPAHIFVPFVLILSALMISRARYLNLIGLRKASGKSGRVIVLLAAVSVLLEPRTAIFAFLLFYALLTPIVTKFLVASRCFE